MEGRDRLRDAAFDLRERLAAERLDLPPFVENVRSDTGGPAGASGYTPLLRDPTPVELRRLALAHERLAQIVRPATPQTIAFMQRQSTLGGILGFLGPVPLVRQMMSAALVSSLVRTATSTN